MSNPKGPVSVWTLNYSNHRPEVEELYVLEGAWFRARIDKAGMVYDYDVVNMMVYLSEEDALMAGVSRCEVEMNIKIRALQESIVIMRNRLDTFTVDDV